MKKQLLATLTISGLILTIGARGASAAVKTDGKAEFKIETVDPTDPEWGVIKPNPDPTVPDVPMKPTTPITPEVVGNVVLMHAPAFNFGENKIDTGDKDYSAFYETGQDVDPLGAPTGTAFAIPHFVQVGDGSGLLDTDWDVTVIQDDYFTHMTTGAATVGVPKLSATTIDLYGKTLTNSQHVATDVLEGLTASAAAKQSIPITTAPAASALTVLNRKDATQGATTATTGTISSVVFQDSYDEADYGTGSAIDPDTERTDAVKLHVPSGQNPVKGTYETKLTWTLSVAP